jgi:hypothetical protein
MMKEEKSRSVPTEGGFSAAPAAVQAAEGVAAAAI